MKTRWIGVWVLAAIYCWLLGGLHPAEGGAIRIRVAHTQPVTHGINVGLLYFKHEIEVRTGGAMDVEIIPEGRWGRERSLLEQVLMGRLQMAVVPCYCTLALVPLTARARMPFLFLHRRDGYRFLDSEFREEVFDRYDEIGLPALAWVDFGSTAVINARKPLFKPEDFMGLRVQGPEDPLFYDTMLALGAVPGSLHGSELVRAVERGEVDALLVPVDRVPSESLGNLNRFVTLPFQFSQPGVLVANNAFWHGLAPKFRALILDAAYDLEVICRGYQVQQEINALVECARRGLSVKYLGVSDRERFREKMAPVYENWAHILGLGPRSPTETPGASPGNTVPQPAPPVNGSDAQGSDAPSP